MLYYKFDFSFSLRLKNDTQEAVLRVRNDRNFDDDRYESPIDMFLHEYPNGDIREGKRRLDGYKPHHKKTKAKKKTSSQLLLSSDESEPNDIQLSEISSDEDDWSSTDSEE